MPGKPVGTIFAELDLDWEPYYRSQKRLKTEATKGTNEIERAYKNLGIKSAQEFDYMRMRIHNSYNRIVNDAKSSADEIVRAERAKNDQLKRLNEQQFGHQTTLISRLKSNWLGISAVVAGVGYAAVRTFGDVINAASDLNETISKSNAVFGTNADEMRRWSESAATSMGLSQRAALETASTMGNMFKQLGAGTDVAAENSKTMVQLAADLASFHNVAGGAEEVLNAMQSAFRGEYDALQRYIPTIKAASVQQVALAKTGKESAKELTELEKATAAMEIIMRDAGDATGDFGRTSSEAANSQRILSAQVENLKAKIGSDLRPVYRDMLSILQSLVSWSTKLYDSLKKQANLSVEMQSRSPGLFSLLGADPELMNEMNQVPYELESHWEGAYRRIFDHTKKTNEEITKNTIDEEKKQLDAIKNSFKERSSTISKHYKEREQYIEQLNRNTASALKEAQDRFTRDFENAAKEQLKIEEEKTKKQIEFGQSVVDAYAEEARVLAEEHKKTYDAMQVVVEQFATQTKYFFSDVLFKAIKGDLDDFGDVWDAFLDSLLRRFTDYFAQGVIDSFSGIFKKGGIGGGSGLNLIDLGLDLGGEVVDFVSDLLPWGQKGMIVPGEGPQLIVAHGGEILLPLKESREMTSGGKSPLPITVWTQDINEGLTGFGTTNAPDNPYNAGYGFSDLKEYGIGGTIARQAGIRGLAGKWGGRFGALLGGMPMPSPISLVGNIIGGIIGSIGLDAIADLANKRSMEALRDLRESVQGYFDGRQGFAGMFDTIEAIKENFDEFELDFVDTFQEMQDSISLAADTGATTTEGALDEAYAGVMASAEAMGDLMGAASKDFSERGVKAIDEVAIGFEGWSLGAKETFDVMVNNVMQMGAYVDTKVASAIKAVENAANTLEARHGYGADPELSSIPGNLGSWGGGGEDRGSETDSFGGEGSLGGAGGYGGYGGYGDIGYQSGTDYVPRTGRYILHKGEKVIPSGSKASSSRPVFISLVLGKQEYQAQIKDISNNVVTQLQRRPVGIRNVGYSS